MKIKHFIRKKLILKLIIFVFTISFFNCSVKDIEVGSVNYTQGGIGTSASKGAILFSFDIPSYYSIGYVRIVLYDDNNSTRTASGLGYKQIRFSNIDPKPFDYKIEFWTYSNNNGFSIDYTFQNGNLVNTRTNSYVNYSNVLNRSKSINKTISVEKNKTANIEIDLN